MKILCVCPNPADATAWFRVISPLRVLQSQAPDVRVQIVAGASTDVPSIAMADILFLQRPIDGAAINCAEQAHLHGRKVWLDYDDDYTDVPVDNPLFHHFGSPQVRKNVSALLDIADLVTVSSQALADRYSKIAKRVVVVRNALDDLMAKPAASVRLPTRTVLWRGGDSHNEDLAHFQEAIVRAAWSFDAAWKFLGHSPYKIMARMQPATVANFPFFPLETYWHKLLSLQPTIVIIPLRKTSFNDAKSWISLIEALWAGAVPLAPRWTEFLALDGSEVPGVVYFDTPEDFEKKLIVLGNTPMSVLASAAAAGLAWVKEHASVSIANKTRALALVKTMEEKPRSLEVSLAPAGVMVSR